MFTRINFRVLLKNKQCHLINRTFCDKKKYTDTVNLPRTTFPLRLKPEQRIKEERQINESAFTSLYSWQRENNQDPEFVLHDGPPYANGDLHMGHAINKILKDLTLKHHIIRNRRVHFKPGWDCHGLPIELKAQSKSGSDPISIRQNARQFAQKTLEKQKKEFQSWGLVGSWDSEKDIYKTLSPDYVQNQLEIFYTLYEKGLIFRDLKPVYWSVSSKTALAEAELEYDPNFKSPSLFVRFEISNFPLNLPETKVYALIWTTTPWTLPSNQAICFNKNSNYSLISLGNDKELYLVGEDLLSELEKSLNCEDFKIMTSVESNLEDLKYFHPINKDSQLNFLHADHVSSSKGTGLVHTAPAHGFDDFLVFLKHGIPVKCLVDELGNYNEHSPEFLQGVNILTKGNDRVLEKINSDIVHLDKITHSYPLDWRTKQPVFIRASHQWFIDTDKIKSTAIEELKKIQIFPPGTAEVSKNSLISQLEKRPYWCISRQRAWGVPIPVYYHKTTKEILCNSDSIKEINDRVSKDGNIDFWWKSFSSENINSEEYDRGNDILDIWFDSGISWSYALEKEKIADLYLEGIDQFTGWFQSSLMTSVALRNKAPYKSIFVHGFALDEKGQKMSKSLGNVIEPKNIIKKYGLDTMRWWIAAHATQHTSILVGDSILDSSKENVQRIRAILKYLAGIVKDINSVPEIPNQLSHLNKFILFKTDEYLKNIFEMYDNYQYNRSTAAILNFMANDLSAIYLNLIKDRLYCGGKEDISEIEAVTKIVLIQFLKSLWPITSHLVEESWQHVNKNRTPFYQFRSEDFAFDTIDYKKSVDLIENCLKLKQLIHKSNTENGNSWNLDVKLTTSVEFVQKLQNFNPDELCEILQVQQINIQPDSSVKGDDHKIESKSIENAYLCPRCRRYHVPSNKDVCCRCSNVLKSK